MNALVLYDSRYGNTERVARAVADALRAFGEARAVALDPALTIELEGVDTLVLGCPTQGWGATPTMRSCLEEANPGRLRGLTVAVFDTRFRMPRWLTGSAAEVMAEELQKKGVTTLVPPESFFVKGSEGPLRSGEADRASGWARSLAREASVAR